MGQKYCGSINDKEEENKIKEKLIEYINNYEDDSEIKRTEIEDDGTVKNLKDPIENYDFIIYCNSFKRLFQKNGWYYKYSENYKEFMEKKNIENDSFCNIGILGESKTGKTFILNKITNGRLSNGISKKTLGLSIKYFSIENNQKKISHYFLFDTEGSFEPLNIKDLKNIKNKIKLNEKFKEYSNDLKLSKILINKYLLLNCNIIIVVIEQMTLSIQEEIINLKNLITKKNFKIIIIHNLQFFDNLQSIDNYKNNLKKSIYNELRENKFINDYEEKKNYFYEKDFINNKKLEIIHVIIGKDNNNSQCLELNKQAFEFINSRIFDTENIKDENFELFKNFKNFLKSEPLCINKTFVYENDIKLNIGHIFCNEYSKNEEKDDDIELLTSDYSSYIEKKKYFVIKIDLPGANKNNIKINYNKVSDIRYSYQILIHLIMSVDKDNEKKNYLIKFNINKNNITFSKDKFYEIKNGVITIKYKIKINKKK